MCKPYIKEGIIDSIVLWNTVDLGYLTVFASNALSNGSFKSGNNKLAAGRLKDLEVVGDEVRLGKPFIFNKDNIDQFNF
jgi:rhamnose transport system permease protein